MVLPCVLSWPRGKLLSQALIVYKYRTLPTATSTVFKQGVALSKYLKSYSIKTFRLKKVNGKIVCVGCMWV